MYKPYPLRRSSFSSGLWLIEFSVLADVDLRWRAVLKDRSRRHNIKLPEPRRNPRTQERVSEVFDESLLKKARFDPKSFAQEFHESVLKDTREKLGEKSGLLLGDSEF